MSETEKKETMLQKNIDKWTFHITDILSQLSLKIAQLSSAQHELLWFHLDSSWRDPQYIEVDCKCLPKSIIFRRDFHWNFERNCAKFKMMCGDRCIIQRFPGKLEEECLRNCAHISRNVCPIEFQGHHHTKMYIHIANPLNHAIFNISRCEEYVTSINNTLSFVIFE